MADYSFSNKPYVSPTNLLSRIKTFLEDTLEYDVVRDVSVSQSTYNEIALVMKTEDGLGFEAFMVFRWTQTATGESKRSHFAQEVDSGTDNGALTFAMIPTFDTSLAVANQAFLQGNLERASENNYLFLQGCLLEESDVGNIQMFGDTFHFRFIITRTTSSRYDHGFLGGVSNLTLTSVRRFIWGGSLLFDSSGNDVSYEYFTDVLGINAGADFTKGDSDVEFYTEFYPMYGSVGSRVIPHNVFNASRQLAEVSSHSSGELVTQAGFPHFITRSDDFGANSENELWGKLPQSFWISGEELVSGSDITEVDGTVIRIFPGVTNSDPSRFKAVRKP